MTDICIVSKDQLDYLRSLSEKMLAGCQIKAKDGTVLYLPDGLRFYQALWTRDFTYFVQNAADLIPPEHIEGCIRYTLGGQRQDGAIPDRVRPDGIPVYAAGAEETPLGKPNLDNETLLVVTVDEYLKTRPDRSARLYHEWAGALWRGMKYVPRDEFDLVFNDPNEPHSPYGFTDTVCKTGELLMESVFYWDACRRLENLSRVAGLAQYAEDYKTRKELIQSNIARLWDDEIGMFWAASIDCRQIDLWGNAYAVYAGLVSGEKADRIIDFLITHFDEYVWQGQIRHLLRGEYWQRLLLHTEPEEYQNGAYWATASGWTAEVIANKRPELAQKIYLDLIENFQSQGVYECINVGYAKLDSYVASATNPYGAARRLFEGVI